MMHLSRQDMRYELATIGIRYTVYGLGYRAEGRDAWSIGYGAESREEGENQFNTGYIESMMGVK